MVEKLQQAIALRKENKPEEAMKILLELHKYFPEDPDLNYQLAWTCDFMGNESAAAPYYEKALVNGLTEDREGAFLGLGSTYRCLGEYEKSLNTLTQGVEEFPNNKGLKTFRALTLYNLGHAEESVSTLLTLLLETTKEKGILDYEKALRFYSDKLNQTWKD